VRLSNGVMDAVLLRGGGHIAELQLTQAAGNAINCLWPAPWPTADARDTDFNALANKYGAAPAGNFLAGYTGHALCLDIFGAPSNEEAARSVPLHGEASARMWSFETIDRGCTARVDLPAAQLEFERSASLAEDAAVLFVDERVYNRGPAAREIHWVQHLSLGPPFLAAGQSAIDASIDRARTWPLGYEGHAMLRDDADFDWPHAPALDDTMLDLRTPFARSGYGFVAAARVDTAREFAFISALNWQLGLVLVYCFRRADFPWIAIWEENCARTSAPWGGNAQVRGMEFGTTPMPVGRDAIRAMGNLFDTPGSRMISAGGIFHANYLAAIAAVPSDWREISNVKPGRNTLIITGHRNSTPITIAANGLHDFLNEGRGRT
jgi:hypothetical protein